MSAEGGAPAWEKWRPYLGVLDFARVPRSKAGWAVRFAVVVLGATLSWRRITRATGPMLHARPPAPIPTAEGAPGERFGIPEKTRHAMFDELAAAELSERARAIAANSWNGHVWSREDDRGHYERVAARQVAARYRVSLTQVYLVLDEGIREKWPAPNGQPLPATTPPLNIRSNSW